MSLRQSVYRPAASLARTRNFYAARSIASSSSTKAAAGDAHHDDHHHHSSAGPDDTQTHETWFSRPFIKFYAATAIAIVGYRFLPETPKQLASPSLDPEAFDKLASDAKMPWLTRKIAGLMESRESLISRGDAYLDSSMRVSKEKILMDDAQRPEVPIRKNKFVPAASPYGVPVGEA